MKKGQPSNVETNFISQSTRIEGQIVSDGDFLINGRLEGSIKCNGLLSVGEHGQIIGEVEAESLLLGGMIDGKVKVKGKITLEAKSHLYGELGCAKLVIEEGAVFEGSSKMNGPKADRGATDKKDQ